jgi:hypothetical protein
MKLLILFFFILGFGLSFARSYWFDQHRKAITEPKKLDNVKK